MSQFAGVPFVTRPGHVPTVELVDLRERIAGMYLAGMAATTIRTSLAAPTNARPIELSRRAIERHMAAVRAGWVRDAEPELLAAARAEQIAKTRDLWRRASRLAQLRSDTALGVGYMNVAIRALEREAKLLGADAAAKVEHSGPKGRPIEVEELDPAEVLRRLALIQEDYAARAAAAGEPEATYGPS